MISQATISPCACHAGKAGLADLLTNLVVVDIADMAISCNPDDILATYSLSSCLGVAVHDPVARIGGLFHAMLPLASIDPEKAEETPYMFVDTGIMAFFQEFFRKGAEKSRTVVKLAGASCLFDKSGFFQTGRRNYAVCRKFLWKNGMLIAAEDVGGGKPRTMKLHVGTGSLCISSKGEILEL